MSVPKIIFSTKEMTDQIEYWSPKPSKKHNEKFSYRKDALNSFSYPQKGDETINLIL
jgi:hypothetical protein